MSSQIGPERILQWTRHLEIKSHNEQDSSQEFVALYNSLYSRKIGPSYYRWEFQTESSPGKLVAGYLRKKLAGVCGYNLLSLSGETGLTGGLFIDMMVTPQHQRTGLVFSRLKLEVVKAATEENAGVLYLFPNPRAAAAWGANPDWISVSEMVTQVAASRKWKTNGSLRFEEVVRFGHSEDEVAVRFEASHPELMMVRRRSSYLNWRFAENPRYRYEQYRVTRKDEPFGYLVLKEFTDPDTGCTYGDLVDALWVSEEMPALVEMLEFALGRFDRKGVSQVCTWLQTNTAFDIAGRRVGFIETGQRRDFLCKVLNTQLQWLVNPGRWFITMADSEVY